MNGQLVPKRQAKVLFNGAAAMDGAAYSADAQVLVQQLVSQIASHTLSCVPLESWGETKKVTLDKVILDVEVDGVRCLLVRLQSQPKTPRVQATLSPREQEIAYMVAKGHPNKTIAVALNISSWTVNTHLRRIFAKLRVCSRAAMVARLLEE